MKRKLGLFILSIVFALSLGVFVAGCDSCNEEPAPVSYRVEFLATEHVGYKSESLGEDTVPSGVIEVVSGTEIKFSVIVEEGFSQRPQVSANGRAISASGNSYTYKVESDTTISVATVSEVEYTISGSGTKKSPYLISSVKDFLFIAEKINEGTDVNYIQGYYSLENDIDCEWATLEVIGNGTTVNSFFGGYFDGKGHTVSNYKIEAQGIDYVGLFGYVQASGTGDELGTIINLNLKDFSVSAHAAAGRNVFAGSFYGYGIAANLIACSAVNGTVDVYGNSYFCYAGGAIGIQQSAIIENNGVYPFYSVVNYVNTDVEVSCMEGYLYAAGGITGYLVSEHEFAPAFISNSYATGNVLGAMRSGGIAGYLGNYASIINCYFTGEVEASSRGDNPDRDYDALAGGIVGYAGFDTVIANSFSNARLYAVAELGDDHAHIGGIVAAKADAPVAAAQALETNCYSGDAANGTNTKFIKETLKWTDTDWVITSGEYPVINHGETNSSVKINLTLNYGNQKVDKKSTEVKTISVQQNYYAPIVDYFIFIDENIKTTPLDEVVVSDSGYTSYGYYFDSALTERVPYGFIPIGDLTLYIGFADYAEVAGTYYYDNGIRTVKINLKVDGTFEYYDLIQYPSSSFRYNGSEIIFNDAIFARLSSVISDESPDLNYEAYKFSGSFSDGTITIVDGVYFTESAPLVITSNKPAVTGDEFKGVWEKSATINKKYIFDGEGGWTYSFKGKTLAGGTYTVDKGVATLLNDGQPYATAKIDASGLLLVNDEYFCFEGSMFGTWFNDSTGNYVRFDGYGSGLFGDVIVNIESTYYELKYIRDGFFGENTVTLLNGYSLFGYLEYGVSDSVLKGVIYSVANDGFVSGYVFYLVDDYTGEWIGDGQIGGVDFKLLNFNGFGTYEIEVDGVLTKLGYVEINGERVAYETSIENGLEGSFEYRGVKYTLIFDDENRIVTVKNASGDSAELVKMDELRSYTLVESNGRTVYNFNGGGYLSGGGVLTAVTTAANGSVTTKEYGYKINDIDLKNSVLNVDILDAQNGDKVGSLSIAKNKFRFILGSEQKLLEIKSPFTGSWSVSGMWQNFTVGNFDLTFTATGKFWDMDGSATYHWNTEANYLAVSYIGGEMTSATTIYILYLQDGNVALSTYPYLSAGDRIYYAAYSDELAGTWYKSSDPAGLLTIVFDGLADSKYSQGIAFDGVTTYLYTRRFGKIYMWDNTDESKMFVLETVSFTNKGEDVYNDGGRRAFRIVPFNSETTAIMTATDNGGVVYEIFLDGTINVGARHGTYLIDNVSGNKTQLVVDLNGEKINLEVDHETRTAKVLH